MLFWLPVTCGWLGAVEISLTAKRRLAVQSNGVAMSEAVGSKERMETGTGKVNSEASPSSPFASAHSLLKKMPWDEKAK